MADLTMFFILSGVVGVALVAALWFVSVRLLSRYVLRCPHRQAVADVVVVGHRRSPFSRVARADLDACSLLAPGSGCDRACLRAVAH